VSEEVNGIDREIKEGELAKGYRPLSGAVICLKYERQGKEVLAKTADIEWLKLISKREIGGSTIEMRIEIAPKSSADAINRNLFDLGLHGQKSGLALPTVSS
jgi:hypothetical protein